MLRPQPITLPRRPFTITPLTEAKAAQGGSVTLVADAHLVPPLEKLRRTPWAWGAALLLHLLVIAAVLLVRVRMPQQQQSPPAVSVVFDNGGTSAQNTGLKKALSGPPQTAEAPPPAPPPSPPQRQAPSVAPKPAPPPPAAQTATQDEVQVPDMQLSQLPAPPPAPPARPRQHTAASSSAAQQKYVFLNGMSYGRPASMASPASKVPKGMNFSLPTSNTQAATASDLSIKGNAGADWDAALTKWVQEHAYYPQAAAEQGQEGTATVEFTVDRSGHVTGLRLLQSAGSPFLDQAWEQLFKDNTLPPFPPDAKDNHVTVRYTVHYKLIR